MAKIMKWLDRQHTAIKIIGLFLIAFTVGWFMGNKTLATKWDNMIEGAFNEQT